MAIKNLEKMDIYNPTNYVNNSEPDIDADNLNKTENKLEETVAKANEIIDALKTLISTVQANSDNTVPSSSLAYAMQQEITKNKEDIATANSNLVNLSGIMPSSTENRKKVADYPDGFSQNNIKYIVSIIYRTDISAWVTLSDGSTTFYLMADGIYAYTSNTNFSQKQFKLALCK